MDYEFIKANLNLYAVLKNLEDVVKYDSEMAALAKDWDISIQFSVSGGPKAYVEFKDGICTVGKGKYKGAKVKLWFSSPAHLNKMMDGNGSPIPLKGFTKLGFLMGDFDKVSKRLEHYLKPDDELLKDKDYLEMNTRLTMNTAAFAVCELGLYDDIGKLNAQHIQDGTVVMKVNKGPAVNITFKDGDIIPDKGDVESPMASMTMKTIKIANDFLNGKSAIFASIASGDIQIKGQTPMLDSMGLILGRIPVYLQ